MTINVKSIWYSYVAKDLLDLIQDLRNEIADKCGTIMDLERKISKLQLDVLTERERTNLSNNDSAIAVQVIRERMRSGEVMGVLSAREHAASQRIRDLEQENAYLLKRIRDRD